jgi:hypothetical protein
MIRQFTLKQALLITLLISVGAIGLSVRLYGITTIGIGGSDTILYYSLAEQWIRVSPRDR